MTLRIINLRWRVARRVFFVAVAIIMLFICATLISIRVANTRQNEVKLAHMAAPVKGESVLVVSPHLDDETLGCSGLMTLSMQRGATVHVAFITNGDAFKIAADVALHTVVAKPSKCIAFAKQRQAEALNALSTVGLAPSQVTFLGYPDRGIESLWESHWKPSNLYTSKATRRDHSPYGNSMTPNAPYCGVSLLNDIENLLKRQQPTDVFVTHPNDNHPDHYATYSFVVLAIQNLKSRGYGFARRIRVHTYLIHRGDWPRPKGDYPREPLAPPHALAHADTKWFSMRLPLVVRNMKRSAILQYKSQAAIDRGFLMSFARRNEVFGDVPVRQVAFCRPGSLRIDGKNKDWPKIAPAMVNPVGDYVIADINKGGGIRNVFLASDGQHLYVRVDCIGHISKTIAYYIDIADFGRDKTVRRSKLVVKPGLRYASGCSSWACKGHLLETATFMRNLATDECMFIRVKTKEMGVTVDNTGWRAFKAESRPTRQSYP